MRILVLDRWLVAFLVAFVLFGTFNIAEAQRSVSSGGDINCVLLSTNVTKCWGAGKYIGSGGTADIGSSASSMGTNLQPIDWGTNLVAESVVVGGFTSGSSATTCAIVYDPSSPSTSRQVRCFGNNQANQLGRSLVLTDDANKTIGDQPNEMGTNLASVNLGTGLLPVSVTVGDSHVCALVANATITGKVKCWGSGGQGQLGIGSFASIQNSVTFGDNMPFMNLNARILSVAAGSHYTCVIASDSFSDHGDVYCTGDATYGQTGQGSTAPINTPTLVNIGTGFTAKKIAAGGTHVCVLIHETSQVKCWGDGTYRANGSPVQSTIGDSSSEMGGNLATLNFGSGVNVTDVFAGAYDTCVILSTGALKCFGDNLRGQLGQGNLCLLPYSAAFDSSPCNVPSTLATQPAINLGTGVSATAVSLGEAHVCVLLNKGGARLKCFGYASFGQLGYEDLNDRGASSGTMGDALPLVSLSEPSTSPTASPTVSTPTQSPSKSPSTSQPTISPTTSHPSKSPSKAPSRTPSRTPSKSPTVPAPTKSPTASKSPTLVPTASKAPTITAAAETVNTVGIAIGASMGTLAVLLAGFVVYRRRDSFFGSSNGPAATNWLAQVDFNASRDVPGPYVPPQAVPYAAPAPSQKTSFESGNPVYAGLALPTQPKKLTRDQVLQKLQVFYAKVDPAKKAQDISDLADWVMANGEEALYVKLRKKYGADPNTVGGQGPAQPKLLFSDDVNV